MRGHAEEIAQALATLGERLAEQLSGNGWNRRLLDDRAGRATLTRLSQDGVMAVVEFDRRGFQWPDDWPIDVEAWLGVGYEPALNLMPLLTLEPQAVLVDDRERGRGNGLALSLDGPDAVAQAVQQIVHFVNQHASAITQNFPDAAAIDVNLHSDIAAAQAPPPSGEGHDSDARDSDTQLRLVLLAATGRYDEARAMLAAYLARHTDERLDRGDRRFVRQLTRLLETGWATTPPVEETLARLPRPSRPTRPSWADARTKSRTKKEALDAVRAQSKGKNLDQLKALVAAEHNVRDIETSPAAIDFQAELLQLEQQPFGRARAALKALRMLKSAGGDMIRVMKNDSDADPEWLQPPDRASYPMIASKERYTAVELDASARDWLVHVRTEAPRRVGPWVLVDVWLTREDPAGALAAHIGAQHVGMVPSNRERFDEVMRAAALFDEDPFVTGRLTRADGAGPAVLEIPLPDAAVPSGPRRENPDN